MAVGGLGDLVGGLGVAVGYVGVVFERRLGVSQGVGKVCERQKGLCSIVLQCLAAGADLAEAGLEGSVQLDPVWEGDVELAVEVVACQEVAHVVGRVEASCQPVPDVTGALEGLEHDGGFDGVLVPVRGQVREVVEGGLADADELRCLRMNRDAGAGVVVLGGEASHAGDPLGVGLDGRQGHAVGSQAWAAARGAERGEHGALGELEPVVGVVAILGGVECLVAGRDGEVVGDDGGVVLHVVRQLGSRPTPWVASCTGNFCGHDLDDRLLLLGASSKGWLACFGADVELGVGVSGGLLLLRPLALLALGGLVEHVVGERFQCFVDALAHGFSEGVRVEAGTRLITIQVGVCS